MADPTSRRSGDVPDTGVDDSTDVEPDLPPPSTGMPRWVKVSGIVVLALVLLFAAAHLTGIGGNHGPGRHMGGDGQEQGTDPDGGHDPSDWDH